MGTIETIRRNKIEKFLLECSHYDKARLIQGCKNRGLFPVHESNEEIYDALVTFSTYNNIKIHTEIPLIKIKDPTINAFIEEIDKEGNTTLVKLNDDEELQSRSSFLITLEKRRDVLSKKLLEINQLIDLYST